MIRCDESGIHLGEEAKTTRGYDFGPQKIKIDRPKLSK